MQSCVHCVLELGDRNIEKSGADFRRKAHQNSKDKAVPRQRLQHKEAAKLWGQQWDRVGSARRVRSSPKCGPDGLNQKTSTGYIFASANSVQHRGFSGRGVGPEKQGGQKCCVKHTWNCVHRLERISFRTLSEAHCVTPLDAATPR